MRRYPLIAVLLPALFLALPATTGAASAKPLPDHASVSDKGGDTPAGVDLVKGTYAISKDTAKWTAKVKKLTGTTFLAFEIWPLAAGWDRIAVYRENGKTFGKLYYVDNEETPTPYARNCQGLKVTWNFGTDKVSVKVPRKCFQASTKSAFPYEFHTFSRFGGQKNGPHDALPKKTLDS